MRKQLRSQFGFSIVEALIAAVLVSVAALGLGNAISQLSKSRTKSQAVSTGIALESALVAGLQSSSTYTNFTARLQKGQIPTDLVIPILGDTGLSIAPGGILYVTKDMKRCAQQSFQDPTCAMMVKLSPMKLINLHYSFAYTIQSNPSSGPLSTWGSANTDDYSVSVPVDVYQAGGSDINCDNPATDIGMMGMGEDGKPICIKKPTAADTCPSGTLAKGFKIIFDSGASEYRLAFNCSAPLKVLSCPSPAGSPYPGGYSLQSFLPVSLDPTAAASALTYNTCTFIASNPSPYVNAGGIANVLTQKDGVQVATACPTGYVPQATRCNISNAGGQDAVCASGITLHYVPVTSAQPMVSGNSIKCQTVVPPQPYCGNNPSNQAKAWADANLSYQCVLDGSVPETIRATAN